MTERYASFTEKDASWLQERLGPESVSVGLSNLELHSRDQSAHDPHLPAVVVWPSTVEEVQIVMGRAQERRLPVTPWGAGTSMEGNPIPRLGGICLDMSRMNRVLALHVEDFQADLEPGVIYQDLNDRLRHHGLFFPPDPGARATVGGMIANNASGTRTVKYGSTRDYVLQLKVVLPGGELVKAGSRASKTASAYGLKHLFIGSEGTLGVIVEATVKLIGQPEEFSAAVASFRTVEEAAEAVFAMMRSGLDPAALELMDSATMELLARTNKLDLPATPALFLEFHGAEDSCLARMVTIAEEICNDHGAISFQPGVGRAERDRLWHARHTIGEAVIRSHPGRKPITTDVAVPISRYAELMALSRRELAASGLPGYIFSHAGDGNLHVVFMRSVTDARDRQTIDRIYRTIVERAIELGGTATGEHGVGMGKISYMEQEHGSGLDWMQRIKGLFDPNGIMNPGKIFPSGKRKL